MTDARVTEMPLHLEAVTEDPFGDLEPAADSTETGLRAIQPLCPERRQRAVAHQPSPLGPHRNRHQLDLRFNVEQTNHAE